MNKRGQFYLIAAIIVISISIGFVVISNSVSSPQNYNINYLKDELSIESQRVINYGIFNQYSNAQMANSLYSFANLYMNSTQQNNWYFVFNGTNGMNFTTYQNFPSTVKIYNSLVNIPKKSVYSQNFNSIGSTINITINNYNYTFQISNESFFFIISNQNGGQNYTLSGP